MKKRDRLAVIHDICKLIMDNKNSIRYTSLLRASRLSSSKFVEYYTELKEKGFVLEISNEGKYVSLTDKGFKYLEKYTLILGLIGEFDL